MFKYAVIYVKLTFIALAATITVKGIRYLVDGVFFFDANNVAFVLIVPIIVGISRFIQARSRRKRKDNRFR